jgi:hypothetical protein
MERIVAPKSLMPMASGRYDNADYIIIYQHETYETPHILCFKDVSRFDVQEELDKRLADVDNAIVHSAIFKRVGH